MTKWQLSEGAIVARSFSPGRLCRSVTYSCEGRILTFVKRGEEAERERERSAAEGPQPHPRQERAVSSVKPPYADCSSVCLRYKEDADSPTEEGGKQRASYSLEFTFDADARVAITIYCQATEEFVSGMAV